jgi:urease accessory protein
MTSSAAVLLVLADGRFPAGAHAHSAGVEAACGLGDIHDLDSLAAYVAGRVASTGAVEAAFTAAACHRIRASAGTAPAAPWAEFDAEFAARTASPAVRAASRSLGRQLLRAADRVWPSPLYADLRAAGPGGAPFQPVALGLVAAVAGLAPPDAALAALHGFVTGMTTAAVRLLGLDPFSVAALVARLTPTVSALAAEAADRAGDPIPDLPATFGLLADVLAEHHATWEVRLFAS